MNITFPTLKLHLAALGLAAVTLGTVSAKAQGTVAFHNTIMSQITTNDLQGHTGLISGSGNYTFGLYVGPLGSSEGALLLVGLATSNLPGYFGGPGNDVNFATSPGTSYSFQVRGWSSFAGNTHEQAMAYATGGNSPVALLGVSTFGWFTLPPSGKVILFGDGPGQVDGFQLTPVPEPSVAVLALVGVLLVCGRAAHGTIMRPRPSLPADK